ncbi:hypothetical protein BC828DRAFT_396624 [Blastocladiella britannica]|nr:hypothetical protein BC828DRAFT_396624 [Blastocladiella britannica]
MSKLVFDSGAVPILMEHVSGRNGNDQHERPLLTLGNMAVDSSACRDTVVDLGLVEHLVNLVTVDSVALGRNGCLTREQVRSLAWALEALTSKWRAKDIKKLDALVPALNLLMQSTDEETAGKAVDGLQRLVDEQSESLVVTHVAELIIPDAILALKRATETPKSSWPDPNGRYLVFLLKSIVSLTAQRTSVPQQVIAMFLTPKSTPLPVREEAHWVLANLLQAGEEYESNGMLATLFNDDYLRAMYAALDSDLSDDAVVSACRCIISMLEFEGETPGSPPSFPPTHAVGASDRGPVQGGCEWGLSVFSPLDMAARRGEEARVEMDEIKELIGYCEDFFFDLRMNAISFFFFWAD